MFISKLCSRPIFTVLSKYCVTRNSFKPRILNSICNVPKREYHNSPNKTDLKTPDLVYIPQVWRWLKTKVGFKVLKKSWDPEFSEGAFIYGSTKAICRITEEISNNDVYDELKDLVTPGLKKKLAFEMKVRLTDLQKKIIVLSPADIKLLIPIEVRLRQLRDKKFCLVSMRSLAVKWHEVNGMMRLVIIALQTEFMRDYTEPNNSEWTVNIFDILECSIVGDVKNAQH